MKKLFTPKVSNIARIFPRKTNATPNDEFVFFDEPPENCDNIEKAHISVTFTYDKEKAEILAEKWDKKVATSLDGPAYDNFGGEFIPGMYLKNGYVITSRGCNNKCWFCSVPRREGKIRELIIKNGHNLLDSNILACSDNHIKKVFEMLSKQKQRPLLTGGLEAKILKWWHVNLLWEIRPQRMYFAYDTVDDLEPLIEAGKKLRYADFTRNHLYCYVLIGYLKDDFNGAEKRLIDAWKFGFMPMAMLWRNKKGIVDENWKKFSRLWSRPAIIRSRMKNEFKKLI
jgi:hypothetical protein